MYIYLSMYNNCLLIRILLYVISHSNYAKCTVCTNNSHSFCESLFTTRVYLLIRDKYPHKQSNSILLLRSINMDIFRK